MVHEKRIIEAFRSNKITRILLIDDAYDPPALNEDALVVLDDFFLDDTNHAFCLELGIERNVLDAAGKAARDGETENEEVETVYRLLYQTFATSRDERIGSTFEFETVKGSALDALKPLYLLLRKCGKTVEVFTAGMEDGLRKYRELRPEIVFLDYYLDSDVLPTGTARQETYGTARQKSLDLLNEIVNDTEGKTIPAVVLMSSYDVADSVDSYRHNAKGQILAVRFEFLKKNMVRQVGKTIRIENVAADALMDVTQGYLFGKEIQGVLTQWRDGAERALDAFISEIGDLHTKDFAYLLRFRLREEGITLNEYLGWLFGECLKGWVEEKTEWNTMFSNLDETKRMEENIEGAFDGPSRIIADLFHRVRVSGHLSDESQRYRLGDLYVHREECNIRAVITPDCDLVPRKNKIKAKSVLTMGGTLSTFDDENAAADDLFVHEKKAYSVQWKPKDLKTFPVDGEGTLHKTYKLLGTLRPLYAQAMQRRALVDLSRIGLPAAPAFGINANATVWIRMTDGIKEIEINPPTVATLIPSRSEQMVGHRVLLRRPFVNELIDHLKQITPEDMHASDSQSLREAIKHDGDKLYKRCLRSGGLTKEKNIFGIGYSLDGKPSQKQSAPWLQIVLEVSDEQMEELSTIDPLE